MARRGRRPEYDTDAERTAARRAQGAKRQQQFRARQRAKLENVAVPDTGASEPAPEGFPPSSSEHTAPAPRRIAGADEEPHNPTTDDPTLERPVNDENPRESRTNLLYWATVLGGRTRQAHSAETSSKVVGRTSTQTYTITEDYLVPLWEEIRRRCEEHDMFRGAFLFVNAKNMKLDTQGASLQKANELLNVQMRLHLNIEKLDLHQTFLDVAREDVPLECSTYLWKSPCLRGWVASFDPRGIGQKGTMFSWCSTRDASQATVELRAANPLRKGGISSAQSYNVDKEYLDSMGKYPFAHKSTEAFLVAPHRLELWSRAAGTPHQVTWETCKAIWLASKARVNDAIRDGEGAPVGVLYKTHTRSYSARHLLRIEGRLDLGSQSECSKNSHGFLVAQIRAQPASLDSGL